MMNAGFLKRGYFSLLILMVVLLLTRSLVAKGEYGRVLVDISTSALLISALFSIRGEFRLMLVGGGLGAVSLSLNWIGLYILDQQLTLWASLSSLLFYLFIFCVIAKDVFGVKEVSVDSLIGTICTYCLLAVIWAHLYQIIALSSTGAFNLPAEAQTYSYSSLDLFYYSFVTLSTLGYGDITPQNDFARIASVFEAVAGQFYLTILVARLVAQFNRSL